MGLQILNYNRAGLQIRPNEGKSPASGEEGQQEYIYSRRLNLLTSSLFQIQLVEISNLEQRQFGS